MGPELNSSSYTSICYNKADNYKSDVHWIARPQIKSGLQAGLVRITEYMVSYQTNQRHTLDLITMRMIKIKHY